MNISINDSIRLATGSAVNCLRHRVVISQENNPSEWYISQFGSVDNWRLPGLFRCIGRDVYLDRSNKIFHQRNLVRLDSII